MMMKQADEDVKSAMKQRTARLQQRMQEEGIDLFLLTHNVDIYYFAGSMQAGFLAVPSSGEAVFYVRRSVERAREESVIRVEPLGSLRDFGQRLADQCPDMFGSGKIVIATEYDVTPAQVLERLKAAIPDQTWRDGSAIVRGLRMIKSPGEIAKIREAARTVDQAFRNALEYVREGMAEYELVARIEFDLRMNGHLGLLRMRGYNQEIITGVVGAGESVARPTYFDGPGGGSGLSPASPQGAGRRKFRRGEPIMVDIGCCIDGYVIDQTRTIAIGSIDEDLAAAYDAAERILRRTESMMKPGAVCEDLYAAALESAEQAGLGHHFMGYGQDQVKFLGHGIGLEVDEWPVLAKGFRMPLEAGMVVAVEPKFTFPGRGMVGIENSYAITAAGHEKLTVSKEGIIFI